LTTAQVKTRSQSNYSWGLLAVGPAGWPY